MKINNIQNAAATGAVKIADGGKSGWRRRAGLVIAGKVGRARRGCQPRRRRGRACEGDVLAKAGAIAFETGTGTARRYPAQARIRARDARGGLAGTCAGPATLSASFTDIRNRDKNNALFVARAEFPIVLVNEGDGSLFSCGGSPDCSSELVGAFYGPGHEEVAGTVTWDGGSDGSAFGFVGAFGAKRQ